MQSSRILLNQRLSNDLFTNVSTVTIQAYQIGVYAADNTTVDIWVMLVVAELHVVNLFETVRNRVRYQPH